ncbi:MAG TPA: hypothetical protein VNA12_05155 [Mycobacteriales bacterium]|nr:hypothetical protein [Mycobacteriales bacterium]
MYGWIWSHLPGNLAAKVAGALTLVAAALALLFLVVFPYAEPRLPFNTVTVDGSPDGAPAATPEPGSPSPPRE